MADGWVALDKSLVRTMSAINRPYSYVEAMFSHSIDVNCGRPWSIKGYTKLWQWDRKKVRAFVSEIRTKDGHNAGERGLNKGVKIFFIDLKNECKNGTQSGPPEGHKADPQKPLDIGADRGNGTQSGPPEGHKADPTIKNNNYNITTCAFFEAFWKAYPRKKSKENARKAWGRAIKKSTPDTIIKAVELQKLSFAWNKDNGQFIPYPATWLNAGGWMDEEHDTKSDNGQSEADRQYEETQRRLSRI